MSKLEEVIKLIVQQENEILTNRYRDHQLSGNLRQFRELHIENDWLLVYRIDNNLVELELTATGKHNEVFRNASNY